ncbi:hypothetical protein Hypma_008617 [Hypsizygus marmoreus]|uniref:Uncharacterized protein n=1 Tax=Hypsizygus marmoreus TaxID=39966 RepID=A0A369JPJ8_HYPMA|nr:hypothetical protein Hypma_008617 [Hypsizygus marmoreus]
MSTPTQWVLLRVQYAQPNEPESPIHKLPVEILGEIFQRYLQIPRDGQRLGGMPSVSAKPSSYSTPIILDQVCSHWRAVALSMPALWSSIAVHLPSPYQVSLIQVWLQRAGTRPLSFWISQSSEVGRVERTATIDILNLSMQYSHRWKHISLCLHDHTPYAELYSMPLGTVGMLESADSELTAWSRILTDRVWQAIYSSSHLCRIRWRKDPQPWGNPMPRVPWAQLTDITMCTPLRLQDLLDILRQCQKLEILTCEIDDDPHEQFQPALLPNLRHLRLFDFGVSDTIGPFLQHLIVPSLNALMLDRGRNTQVFHGLAQDLQGLLIRSQCHLEKLAIFDSALEEDDVIRVLEVPQLEDLTELNLSSVWVTPRTFERLTHNQDPTTVIMPHLRALVLPRCSRFTYGATATLIMLGVVLMI